MKVHILVIKFMILFIGLSYSNNITIRQNLLNLYPTSNDNINIAVVIEGSCSIVTKDNILSSYSVYIETKYIDKGFSSMWSLGTLNTSIYRHLNKVDSRIYEIPETRNLEAPYHISPSIKLTEEEVKKLNIAYIKAVKIIEKTRISLYDFFDQWVSMSSNM